VAVYLDYAHHPTEVRAALAALRERARGRILVAFQPHLYSRTRDYADSFGRALADADEALLVDIYPAREAPIPGVTAELLVRSTREAGGRADGPVGLSGVPAALAGRARPGDTLVCMGAGDIGRTGDAVLEHLAGGPA
jgi:UDP-N-acetylmuramate--alanine ligase